MTPLERRISKRTGVLVAGMVSALRKVGSKATNLEKNPAYREFRELKRELYALYPEDENKARAIVNFALVESGWSFRGH